MVKPAVAANVGAAARALKTMGFSELRLVNPCDHLGMEARMLAHGSNDILENTVVFNSLAEAVDGIDYVVGTTARRRTSRIDYLPADKLPELLVSKQKSIHTVAIVFGSEESGLSNDDLRHCDLLSSVSMVATYPSLNLAQAVMVMAYELSVLAGKKPKKVSVRKDTAGWNALKQKAEPLFDKIGLTTDNLIRTRIMERFALLGDTDVKLLHSILAAINKKFM